jgi:hypothetical protein
VVEEGACLLIDSSRRIYKSDGGAEDTIVSDKLLLVDPANDSDVRLAAAHSGPSPVVRRPRPLPDDGGDFFTAAENVWATLSRVRWANYVPMAERTFEHEALVCGSRCGDAVKLIRMGTDAPPRIADEGSVFGIGLASGIWKPRMQPHTIADATTAVLELFTERMRHAERLGVSWVSWPAHMAIVTPERIDTYEFGETNWRCRW